VGIVVHHKVGDRVEAGESLFTVHAATTAAGEAAGRSLLQGVVYSRRPVPPLPLFYRTLRS
jgi:pyrimidine-nucleoside phosphorylase